MEGYFKGDASEAKTLRDVFEVFVQSAQEYHSMPGVIQFNKRKKLIGEILSGFDYEAVVAMDEENLCHTFRNTFHVVSADSKQNSWRKWSRAIVDSAKFVNGFTDLEDFTAFVRSFEYNSDTRMALPLLIDKKIRGIGFALACNTLKELGYLGYPKPDVHLMDICEGLGLSSRNPYEVFEVIVKMAADNEVTPYEVDKVLWLISSGKYYIHKLQVKPRKEDFIREMKQRLI